MPPPPRPPVPSPLSAPLPPLPAPPLSQLQGGDDIHPVSESRSESRSESLSGSLSGSRSESFPMHNLNRYPSPGSPDLDSRLDWRASVGYSVSGTRWLPSPCSMQRPFRVYHRLSESPIRVAYPSCLSESRIRNTMTADSWRQLRFLASKNPSRCVARRPPPARLLIFTAASACHGASVCAAAWRVRLRPAHSSASTSP